MLNTPCSTPWDAFNLWAAIHSGIAAHHQEPQALIYIFVTDNHQLSIHLLCLQLPSEGREHERNPLWTRWTHPSWAMTRLVSQFKDSP